MFAASGNTGARTVVTSADNEGVRPVKSESESGK
jgi:hypothetical protein